MQQKTPCGFKGRLRKTKKIKMILHYRLKNVLNQSSLKGFWYALREIALIVIGVLIAVWIDNMNEQRKDKILEIKTLRALSEGLKQDSTDIANNIIGLKELVDWRMKVNKIVEGKMPIDSFTNSKGLSNFIFFLNNAAPYENLKSIGFSKITNDSIRNQIINLYELNYKVIIKNEERYNAIVLEKISPYHEKCVFLSYQGVEPKGLITYLRKEKNFVFDNFIAAQTELFELYSQKELLPKIVTLKRNIDKISIK